MRLVYTSKYLVVAIITKYPGYLTRRRQTAMHNLVVTGLFALVDPERASNILLEKALDAKLLKCNQYLI